MPPPARRAAAGAAARQPGAGDHGVRAARWRQRGWTGSARCWRGLRTAAWLSGMKGGPMRSRCGLGNRRTRRCGGRRGVASRRCQRKSPQHAAPSPPALAPAPHWLVQVRAAATAARTRGARVAAPGGGWLTQPTLALAPPQPVGQPVGAPQGRYGCRPVQRGEGAARRCGRKAQRWRVRRSAPG